MQLSYQKHCHICKQSLLGPFIQFYSCFSLSSIEYKKAKKKEKRKNYLCQPPKCKSRHLLNLYIRGFKHINQRMDCTSLYNVHLKEKKNPLIKRKITHEYIKDGSNTLEQKYYHRNIIKE